VGYENGEPCLPNIISELDVVFLRAVVCMLDIQGIPHGGYDSEWEVVLGWLIHCCEHFDCPTPRTRHTCVGGWSQKQDFFASSFTKTMLVQTKYNVYGKLIAKYLVSASLKRSFPGVKTPK